MKILILVIFLVISFINLAYGQDSIRGLSNYQLHIRETKVAITIDGSLDEDVWSLADKTKDFWMQYPKDNVKAVVRTEVRLAYDSDNLYIAAICYDVQDYVVQTLKRDKDFFEGDAFGVIIDPVNSRTNGFLFGLSPYNVQTEELLGPSPPKREDMNFSWDNRWYSATARFPDRYVVEIAIPFKTLRFKDDITTWGINFFRNDLSRNQYYSWTPIPVNFELYDIGYTGRLIWDKSPPKTGINISARPYVIGRVANDRELVTPETKISVDAGIDAKIGLTSSLNIDLTVNPDFSQVDADVQQTNLTRFSLKFPEKREFFLENMDLFAEFASNDARPIFTRRIGLDENRRPIPILYGARLSGNLNPKLRIGLMNLQTKAQDSAYGQNYTIGVFNYSMWSRSVLKGYITNRKAYEKSIGLVKNNFGRNAGMEFNYLNNSGSWNYFVGYHISDKPNIGIGTFGNFGLEYAGRKWKFRINYWNISSDYYADIGFIPRLDNYDAANNTIVNLGWERVFGRFGYTIRPSKGHKVVSHYIELRNYTNLYQDRTLNDQETRIDYEIKFSNTSKLMLQPQYNQTNLIFATDFTDGGAPLMPGMYIYPRFNLFYQSDSRKSFSIQSEFGIGEYYNAHLSRYMLQVTYRRQPWGNFSVSGELNNLKLPEPYGKANPTLINVNSEVGFSTKLFWTTFLQYNTQQENFNINSRLQWRYSTLSDIFLVYTSNYFISPFLQNNKNGAVLLKINYMFNF